MKELNVVQMEEIEGGTVAANWCGGVSVGITILSFVNPIAGGAAGLMWAGACWWLGG